MPQVGSRLADDVTNLTTNIVELLVIMKLKSASSSFFIASRVLRVRVGGVRFAADLEGDDILLAERGQAGDPGWLWVALRSCARQTLHSVAAPPAPMTPNV